MKMFALSCKLEREFRCVELAEMMTQNVVTLAMRYASRSRRMVLAQRLSELALEKANQLQEEEGPDEQEEETEHTAARWNSGHGQHGRRAGVHHNTKHTNDEEECGDEMEDEGEMETAQEEEEEAAAAENKKRLNPFAKGAVSPEKPVLKPISKEGRVNPFKVSGSGKPSPSGGQPGPRVTNVLDSMASVRRPVPLSSSAGKPNKGPILKPLAPKPKTKTQSTLLHMTASKTAPKAVNKKPRENSELPADMPKRAEVPPPAPTVDNSENRKPKTGFQLWLEENRKSINADQPDLEEADIIKEAMSRFRTLSAEDRLAWTERAKGPQMGDADLKKRKRDGGAENDVELGTDENNAKKKKPLDTSAKLSAFAFNKS